MQPAPVAVSAPLDHEREHPRSLARVSPVTAHGLVTLALAYVVLSGVAILVGLLIVDHLGAVRDLDTRVSNWLGAHRSDTWNDVTWVGSGIADIFVKVPAAAVLVAFFFWRWRRWHEAALLAGVLAFEAAVFVTASIVVGRDRPAMSQLDPLPLTSSYPSGHTAAAVAFYGAIVVIVFWHTRRTIARQIAVAAMIVLVVFVGASRMYRGMHHLSDVVVGVAVGAVSLLVMYLVVRRPPRDAVRDCV